MRNQYMAKVLVHNKVVTQDQIDAHWAEANDQVDIGQVLVQAGILGSEECGCGKARSRRCPSSRGTRKCSGRPRSCRSGKACHAGETRRAGS